MGMAPNQIGVAKSQASAGRRFEQVFDGRKERARGLWMRDGKFYARITATEQSGRKRDMFRALDDAKTVPAAKCCS